MAALFDDVSQTVVQTVQGWSWGHVVLVLLIVLVIVFIVMMLMGRRVSLSALDIRPHRFKVMDGSRTFWKGGSVGTMHNLRAVDDTLPLPSPSSYTYHLDIMLADSRNLKGVEGPYRHLFHRGSDDIYTPSGVLVPTSDTAATLPPYGLPARMNPGIVLDPNTNDILIFVDTKSRGGDVYRESVRLPDIPLDKPFRLTVSVQDNVLSVSINCRLDITKVLNGVPRAVENVLYGLCGAAAAQASIQNLIVWPYSVSSTALGYLCPPRFGAFAPSVVPSCGVASGLAVGATPPSPQPGPVVAYSFKCASG
jgi:hypothetical protein